MKKTFIIYSLTFMVIGLFLTNACKKEDPATLAILKTSIVSNISASSAITGGIITSDGGASLISIGVCWGTSENPTTSDSKTSDNVSNGQFVSNITGLNAGTTYHVRAYAKNAVGTAYGSDVSFLTLGEAPAGVTMAASNISVTEATLNGSVNPNYISTTVTFEYGTTTSYGQTATVPASPISGNSVVNVSVDISGLTAGTVYHFRLKTVNSLGTVYGSDMTFTTLGGMPTGSTQAACCLSGTGATLNGIINANYVSTTVAFEYGTTASYGSSVTATQSPVSGSTNTSVTASITGLSLGTTYHFRVKAVNSLGTLNGNDLTFTTLNIPTLTTKTPTNVTYNAAKSGGNITSDGGAAITARGVCWSTNSNPTIALTTKTNDGAGTGIYSSSITGLTPNTLYYVRAYATNSAGTSYGNQVTFTTTVIPPTDGLVGYWTFTGNANDASGNNHNGTVNGAILTSDKFGNANCAYSFDGLNDYIAIAPSSLVDNETAATLSFWIKRDVNDDYGLPIHTGNQGYLNTQVKKDSVLVAVCTNSSYDGSAPTEFGVKWTYIQQTQWNHIILRYDGAAKNLKLYINGIFSKETFAEGNIWSPQSAYLAFGVYYLFGTPHHGYYKGILDDVRLYKRALNDAEIQSLYHENGW